MNEMQCYENERKGANRDDEEDPGEVEDDDDEDDDEGEPAALILVRVSANSFLPCMVQERLARSDIVDAIT